jgi:periplasmic protein TonB
MNDLSHGEPMAKASPTLGRHPRSAGRDAGDRRALIITLLASIALHVAAATAIVLLPRGGALIDAPGKPAEVELVMEEHKGDMHPASPQNASTDAKPDAAEQQPVQEQQSPSETPAPAAPPPVEADVEMPRQTSEPAKASLPSEAAAPAEQTDPVRSDNQPAPTITLGGTDSPSDARAWGDRIIPAAPDAVFHNRPPEYPRASVIAGEHGTVIVLIHVTATGNTSGVDLVRSSGYALLDRAAREAVTRWRFLPAVKDGQPVPSDMQMGFIFDYE